IEDSKQQIAETDQPEYPGNDSVVDNAGQVHQQKPNNSKHETRRWSSNSNSKLRTRTVRFIPQPCQSAEGMKHYLVDLDSLRACHQCVRELMAQHRQKQADSSD